jgi:RNA polymerase sigma factor (sigma-70 family)
MVLGYAMSIVRSRQTAEDVFQEVVLAVLKKHDSIESEKAFPSWIRTATRFHALKALRLAKNQRVVPLDHGILEALEPHWERQEGVNVLNEALNRCIERLTRRARQLIVRRFRKNESCADIARQERKPVHTIHVAFSRIYTSLRLCMEAASSSEEVGAHE